MASFADIVDRIRGFDIERTLGLRAAAPRVAIELDGNVLSLVRLRTKRGARPTLEAHAIEHVSEPAVPASMFDHGALAPDQLGASVKELLARTGARAARVGVVLPDNLAKISLLQLPERPPGRRQLEELIRFKMNRAVPFRVHEASLSYQVFPSEGRSVAVLVALTRQPVVERLERAFEAAGARPGLIDLCSPNLLNLCRAQVRQVAGGGDVALLNCTASYFSLLIVRQEQLIFYRCKSYAIGNGGSGGAPEPPNGLFVREVAGSLAYYKEKLGGTGISAMLVRSVVGPIEPIRAQLGTLGVERVEPVDATLALDLGASVGADSDVAQRLAPALGATVARN
jgi:hypothetical protein